VKEMNDMEIVRGTGDHMAPTLVEETIATGLPLMEAPVFDMTDLREEEPPIVHWQLRPATEIALEKLLSKSTNKMDSDSTVGKMSIVGKTESIISTQPIKETDAELILSIKDSTSATPVSAASGGYLARPSNIYAESKTEVVTSKTSAEEPVPLKDVASQEEEDLLNLQMQIVERDDIPAADMPLAHQAQPPLSTEVEDPALRDETEEQKRRAAERLHKLRNLSFNVNAADPNNEFETVPAYIRRNMELYNTNSQVENFYSNYEVKTDQNNQTQISTINTFLDGKKPD
jgi:cell division protein FtsZ